MKKTIVLPATDDNLQELFRISSSFLEENQFSHRDIILINTALEEVFINIAHYAYESIGTAEIIMESDDKQISFTFIDSGVPFNPLEVSSPDISASSENRSIGGLGIFMVKEIMSNVEYHFLDNKNILKLTKNKNI